MTILSIVSLLRAQGRAQLVADLMDAVLSEKLPGRLRVEALLHRAEARGMLGEHAGARVDAEAALALGERVRAHALVGRAAGLLGSLAREAGRPDEAEGLLARSLRLARRTADGEGETEALARLAMVHWSLAREDHLATFEAARRAARRHRLPLVEGAVHGNLGAVLARVGDDAGSERHMRRAAELFRRHGDRRRHALALLNLGCSCEKRGDLELARDQFAQALATFEAISDRQLAGTVEGHLGLLEQRQGGPGAGEPHLRRAVARLAGGRAWDSEALFVAALAANRAAHDRVEEAAALLGHAERLGEGRCGVALRTVLDTYRGHLDLARARRAARADDDAAAGRQRASALARLAAAEGFDAARSAGPFGTVLLERADVELAVRLLRQVLERALAPQAPAPADPAQMLVVGATAAWFRAPGGALVDLSRRGPLARLLAALVVERRDPDGVPLEARALIAAGWPDERIVERAAQNRLHVAISTLRSLGLRGLLLSGRRGYFLDRGVGLAEGYRATTILEPLPRPEPA